MPRRKKFSSLPPREKDGRGVWQIDCDWQCDASVWLQTHMQAPASKTTYNSSKQHIKTVTLVPKILNKTKCGMFFFSLQPVDRKNTSAHTQADCIWSSPMKEENTENSLSCKWNHPRHHHPNTHTHAVPYLAFLALLLLHCSTNVTLDMTPTFFSSPYTCRGVVNIASV